MSVSHSRSDTYSLLELELAVADLVAIRTRKIDTTKALIFDLIRTQHKCSNVVGNRMIYYRLFGTLSHFLRKNKPVKS